MVHLVTCKDSGTWWSVPNWFSYFRWRFSCSWRLLSSCSFI